MIKQKPDSADACQRKAFHEELADEIRVHKPGSLGKYELQLERQRAASDFEPFAIDKLPNFNWFDGSIIR